MYQGNIPKKHENFVQRMAIQKKPVYWHTTANCPLFYKYIIFYNLNYPKKRSLIKILNCYVQTCNIYASNKTKKIMKKINL